MHTFHLPFVMLCIASISIQHAYTEELPLRIPAESQEHHELTNIQLAVGINQKANYNRVGELSLFSNSYSLFTRNIAANSFVPFDGVFYQVVSSREIDIVIDIVPGEKIPVDRRLLPGCYALPEKSSCRVHQEDFSVLKIVKEQEQLRCEIYDAGTNKILPKTFGVGDSIDLAKESFVIKRILPAAKNFPAWIEFEHKQRNPIPSK
jgi:hypothetical protein